MGTARLPTARRRRRLGPEQAEGSIDAPAVPLQQQLGNAALARMLQREPAPATITGNPKEPEGVRHLAPRLADSTHGAAGGEASVSIAPMNVRPLVTEAAPIEAASVRAGDLYEVGPETSVGDGFEVVTEMIGTPERPVVAEDADSSLFIDPGPTSDDVWQGGIGDCWELSTLAGIVESDPAKIRSMMEPDDEGGATITFHRRVEAPADAGAQASLGGNSAKKWSYVPERIRVSNELAFRTRPQGPGRQTEPVIRSGIFGAGIRAADVPSTRRWYCDAWDSKLVVRREDVFQMARWVPLIEKAGARFSELFGQYGHGATDPGEKEKAGPDGYANLKGGDLGSVLTMFYGADAEQASGNGSPTAWAPGMAVEDLLAANVGVLDALLRLDEAPASGSIPWTQSAGVVTAGARGGEGGKHLYYRRLHRAIGDLRARPEWAQIDPVARRTMARLEEQAREWGSLTSDDGSAATALQTAVESAGDPECIDAVLAASSPSARAVVDLVLVVKEFGRDSSPGRRSVYSPHAYAVLAADIRTRPPLVVDLASVPASLRADFYRYVDLDSSTVTLRNPHHGNEPDASGNGPEDGVDDGVFALGLERFLRLFSNVNGVSVPVTR